MHFEGQQTINASQQTVWAFFMDPNKVAECAPGFKSMEILSPDHFKPTLAVGVGAVKATFTLDVTLADMQEPSHAAMLAHGVAAGSAVDMRSALDLIAQSDTVTEMRWTADVNVRGAIASTGARLLEGTAHKLTDRFFDCLRQKLEATPTVPAAE
jgi:carbon monoxide dehydrogenase subunit G